MLKSEMYRKAAEAVVLSDDITMADKLEIVRLLLHDDEIARYTEEREAKREREAAENGEI